MSNDLVVKQESQISKHDPNVSLNLQKVADGLFKSGMFPNAKNAFGAFAIVEYGHELGIPPMMALKNINIISGQLACNAQLMLSMAMSRGVTYRVIKETDKGAEIEFCRGDMKYTATFTEEDAKSAGLTGKDNWKKYARDMYFWRATAKGIRRIAPDAVLGLYTKDEISNGEIVDVTPQAETTPENIEKKEIDFHGEQEHPENDIPPELGTEPVYISAEEILTLQKLITQKNVEEKKFLDFMGVDKLEHILADEYKKAEQALQNKKKAA